MPAVVAKMQREITRSPARQLAGFLAKYDPAVRRVAVEAIASLRARLPGTVELVYDSYNNLAVTFGPTERVADAVFSITVYPRRVSLFFTHGAGLPDPQGLLIGAGSRIRHIVLDDASMLDRPAVRRLMRAAVVRAGLEPDRAQPGRLIIKSVSARQRPRRPSRQET
jgi:hypothetical protein